MANIQVKRGLKANLPTLNIGELAFCTDTKELFVGSSTGNVLVNVENNGGGAATPKYIVKDSWNTSGTRTFPAYMHKLYIFNSGDVDVTVTINSMNFVIKAKEEFEDVFDPFSQVIILTSGSFYATASNLESGSPNPDYSVKDAFSGSSNVTHNFSGSMNNFLISNDGVNALNYTIDSLTIQVLSGQVLENSFDPFNSVIVNASVPFRAFAKGEFSTDNIAPIITASVNGGFFNTTQTVALTANETATIYYTTNGSTPTQSSTVYSTPISITNTTTLKYFGKDLAGNLSSVQTQVYTFDTVAPTVTALPVGGTYTSTQSVTLAADETATIYYTTNGTTPTTSSTVYSTPISISATTTLKFFGRDTIGNSSTVQSINYTINLPDITPPNPVTGLAAGTVTDNTIPISWTLSNSGDVANYEVAYSTDGTNYTVASAVINSSSTSYTITGLTAGTFYTIRVIAIDGAGNRSTAVTTNSTTTSNSEIVVALDSFTRSDTTITSDSATTLGSTSTGGLTWTNSSIYWNYGIISNKAYQQRSNNGGTRYRHPVTIPNTNQNYAVEVTLATIDTLGTGNESIHFRTTAGTNFDTFWLQVTGSTYNLVRLTYGGSPVNVGIMTAVPVVGDRVRIESYQNGRILVYINGVLKQDVLDTSYVSTSTRVGFASANNVSRFDDFKLTQLSAIATDTVAPGNVTLGTIGSTQTTVNLNWTNPSDVDFYQCEIYNGASLIATVTPSNTTSKITGSYVVTSLTPSTNYTFTIKTKDWSGNTSSGVNVNKTTLAVGTLYLNGSSTDYLSLPSITFDRIDIDCYIDSINSTWSLWSADTTANYATSVGFGTNVATVYSDGLILANNTSPPKNSRFVYRIDLKTPITKTSNLFSNSVGTSNMRGFIYKATCYSGGSIVANYDLSSYSGTAITDTTGNGNTATLHGGTSATSPFMTLASPNAGTFSTSKTVSLSANTASTIYYTTDGSTPTTSSSVYSSPITFSTATTTLKTLAVDASSNQSSIGTFVYTKDTTVPVTNIFPNPNAGIYTGSQTVTILSLEPTTIYYTLDNTDPTTSSTVYTNPVTINSSTNVKYFAIDTAGNVGTIQTASYVIDGSVTPNTLATNGLTNYIKLPSLTFDSIELTMSENKSLLVTLQYILDARTGIGGAYAQLSNTGNDSWAGFASVTKDGSAVTTNTNVLTSNTKAVLKFNLSSAGTDDLNIFSNYLNDQMLQGNLYGIKITNGATTVAQYDFTTPFAGSSVTDTSGNNKTATLNGTGTWVLDLVANASIPGGNYVSGKLISLNTNRAATVYYTVDGSTPTTSSSVYSTPLAINSNTTIKYFAKDASNVTTPIRTEVYNFNQVSLTSGLIHNFNFSKGTGTQTSIVDTVGGQLTLNLSNFKFDSTDGWVGNGLKFFATNNTSALSPDMTKFGITNGNSCTFVYYLEFYSTYGQQYVSTSNGIGGIHLNGSGGDPGTWGRFSIGQISIGATSVHAAANYRDNVGGTTPTTVIVNRSDYNTAPSTFLQNKAAVVAVTVDASTKTFTLYFNGALQKSITFNSLPRYDNIVFNNVNQIAHSLHIYNRALTAGEILSVSNEILK